MLSHLHNSRLSVFRPSLTYVRRHVWVNYIRVYSVTRHVSLTMGPMEFQNTSPCGFLTIAPRGFKNKSTSHIASDLPRVTWRLIMKEEYHTDLHSIILICITSFHVETLCWIKLCWITQAWWQCIPIMIKMHIPSARSLRKRHSLCASLWDYKRCGLCCCQSEWRRYGLCGCHIYFIWSQ